MKVTISWHFNYFSLCMSTIFTESWWFLHLHKFDYYCYNLSYKNTSNNNTFFQHIYTSIGFLNYVTSLLWRNLYIYYYLGYHTNAVFFNKRHNLSAGLKLNTEHAQRFYRWWECGVCIALWKAYWTVKSKDPPDNDDAEKYTFINLQNVSIICSN